MAGALFSNFLAALPEACRSRFDPVELEAALASLLELGRRAWPEVAVAEGPLAVQVARALGDAATPAALAELRPAELYLATACAAGDARALALFERDYFGELKATLARLDQRGLLSADEATQRFREWLFAVPGPGERPGVAKYGGRGELRNWVRVTAGRMVLKLLTRNRSEEPTDDEQLELMLAPVDGPEVQHMKKVYRDEFREAFRGAFSELPPRERNLIRYALKDHLNIDEIGALFGVHRATAARWLAHAHEDLKNHLLARIEAKIGLSGEELKSAMRMVRSQIEISTQALVTLPKDGPAT